MKTIQGTRTTVTVGRVELVIDWKYSLPGEPPLSGVLQVPSENESGMLFLVNDGGDCEPVCLIGRDGDIYRCAFQINLDTGQYLGFGDSVPSLFVDGCFVSKGNPIGHVTDLLLV